MKHSLGRSKWGEVDGQVVEIGDTVWDWEFDETSEQGEDERDGKLDDR